MRTCIVCGEEFQLRPNKPGKITHCPDCSVETTTKYLACVAFDGKNHGSIEITKDQDYANAFNKAQMRRGYGVVGNVVERKSGNLATVRTSVVRTAVQGQVVGGVKINSSTRNGIQETYTRR